MLLLILTGPGECQFLPNEEGQQRPTLKSSFSPLASVFAPIYLSTTNELANIWSLRQSMRCLPASPQIPTPIADF
jgi:hypothetical protein